jgi:hypothetical protein
MYLFLPRKSSPPYQTLIFFPGSYAIESKEIGPGAVVNSYLDFILKSGRAAAFPVYFRTYERNDGKSDYYPVETHQYTEVLIKWVKDFSRTIDYLETRGDIDTSKLGFYGHSLGGRYDSFFPLKKSVMPFFNNLGTPEADMHLILYETGHYVSKSDRTRELLSWCDKYLGPVK